MKPARLRKVSMKELLEDRATEVGWKPKHKSKPKDAQQRKRRESSTDDEVSQYNWNLLLSLYRS